MSHEVMLRGLETPFVGQAAQSPPKHPPRAGGHAGFSLCGSLLPQQVPWGLGGSEPGWTDPTVWFPQTPEPGWRGHLQGAGSVRPEGGGRMPGQLCGPSLPCVPDPSLEPMEQWGEGKRVCPVAFRQPRG